MYLRQQAADAITGLSNLAREIIVEATQHRELRDFVVGPLQRTQRVRMLRAASAMMYASRACVFRMSVQVTASAFKRGTTRGPDQIRRHEADRNDALGIAQPLW